ncbi:phage baseplate protein [Intestinibacter sp.]|uniref:phage baseplate protein n=1 Tax=Intestinibacter sp. TaxID=1965304 RepID=UPI003F18DF6F
MAINKKFIHFKKKIDFENELSNNNILDTSICFISETKEIYTHKQLYNCSGIDNDEYTEIKQSIEEINEKINNIEIGGDITIQGILEMVYPVGSIYISVNSINPSSLFGFGTWEQIKDKFLLATGDIHGAGEIGGEESHTLTSDEIPSHSHQFNRQQLWQDDTGVLNSNLEAGYGANNKKLNIYTDNTTSVGGGLAHNNMPPYLSVYIFKRIQ